ncbi:hypothetical protein PO124_13195 [Bacillus licheniformis]|nr:hypothetical protein [Bacillus licheniformis]
MIVGTGTWSQDVNDAADNQLKDGNVMYALHFMRARTVSLCGIKPIMHSAKERRFRHRMGNERCFRKRRGLP